MNGKKLSPTRIAFDKALLELVAVCNKPGNGLGEKPLKDFYKDPANLELLERLDKLRIQVIAEEQKARN